MFREPLTPLELGDTWSQRWTNFGKFGKSGILLTTSLILNPEFTVSDVKNFRSELSPTPNSLFCLDFSSVKMKTNCTAKNYYFFRKRFRSLIFSIIPTDTSFSMIEKMWRVCRNDRKNRRSKKFSQKIIVFGGTVCFHLYRGKNPSKKDCLVLEKVLTENF